MSTSTLIVHSAVESPLLKDFLALAKVLRGNEQVSLASVTELQNLGSSSSYDSVIATFPSSSLTLDLVASSLKVLKPNGIFQMQLTENIDATARAEISSMLVLGGLMSVQEQPLALTGVKPAYAAASVSLKKRSEPQPPTWKVQMNACSDDLINEDDLLADGIEVPKAEACGVDGAPVKRACKNCTCGLAEKLSEPVKLSADEPAEPHSHEEGKSACGNCYKGDAFRCSTCPYRGLPPFKAGEKVSIPSLIDADI
eukprot:TRINITY_DN389_c0_g1::TRINITY_DN389_c0_g1_i1::g.7551::m.7551 TRINITY_DN389_c0_g1::TRINITY_DN389_c0_g1_i1::g.7551  ORF type:complete len:264 (-),score=50.91,sp/Q5EAC7/CPIN1_BOVIN/32.28/1e-29,CIAPIN1/PF05093.8/1.3e-23 TRINITY_DN389_c0_g1_i1:19-783(-)